MRYISLFSGIEAASCAWRPMGWRCLALSEVDPFCLSVLSARVPEAPNLGDIRDVDWGMFHGNCDVVIGGSPCQSFSVAGRREGLAGESGLMLEYIRAVSEVRPRCFVWENVPGALSCEGGAAFGLLLGEMDALGYGLAWRVLDSQFFGVPQRRERVFLVGVLGSASRACEVLLEPEGLPWDTPSSKEKRAALASGSGDVPRAAGFKFNASAAGGIGYSSEHSPTITGRPCPAVCYGIAGNVIGRSISAGGNGAGFCDPDEAGMYTLTAADRHAVACATQYGEEVAGTLTARGDSSPCADRGPSILLAPGSPEAVGPLCARDAKGVGSQYVREGKVVCLSSSHANAHVGDDLCGCLAAHAAKDAPVAFCQNCRDEIRLVGGDGSSVGALTARPGVKQASHVMEGMAVRRLTPLECERLQGFPDGWTDVEHRGKPAPDTQRYKALGNSMTVPVIEWIGRRIEGALA